MKHVVIALIALVVVTGCEGQFEGPVQVKQWGRVVAEGQYENGTRVGTWVYYDNLGRVKGEGTYENGKMQEGLEILYHDNNQTQAEGTWTDGKRDGYWIAYYRSGAKKAEGMYVHGNKTGVWKEYDPSGYYVTEKVFENDKLVGWRQFRRGRVGNPLNG